MGGKAALFLVIGFSIIFLVVGRNISNTSVRAFDNSMAYFSISNAHSIALVGANIAATKVFFDNSWDTGYENVPFNGGKYSVTVQTIDVSRQIVKITSIGTFGSGEYEQTHKIEVKLQPSSFSRFGYFSNREQMGGSTIWWTSKDTVWGPFHSNDVISINGDPVFQGKTSSYKGLAEARGSNPEFNGGYSQSSELLPIPEDGLDRVEAAAIDDGLYFNGQDTVYLEFKNDSLTYKFGANEPDTTLYLPAASNNGTIFASGANIRMQGVVDGRFTVGASQATTTTTGGYWKWNRRDRRYDWVTTTSTSTHGGQIFLDDDIIYKDNPLTTSSDDVLGIVAENEIFVTDNAANSHDINIHASLFSQKKGFGAENYAARSAGGFINLLGGITQESRMAVGTFSGSGVVSGFSKRYRYDDRLMVISPPVFPGTGNFEIVSWFE